MEIKKISYYFFAVLAYALPIIWYILNPGQVGTINLIATLLLVYVYYKLKKSGLTQALSTNRNFKYCLWIIIAACINTIVSGGMNYSAVVYMLLSIMGYISVVYVTMVGSINSVLYFCKSFMYVLIPVAIISYFMWTGFLTFDIPHVFAPLTLFVPISAFFPKKKMLLITGVVMFSVVYDYSVRVCLLSATLSILILIGYIFCTTKIYNKILRYARLLLLFLPLFFLTLSIWGNYNVFAVMEDQDVSFINLGSGRKSDTRSFNTDSRTGVYLDVANSVQSTKEIIIGKGEVINLEVDWKDGTDFRHSTEAGILNIFLRYGLVGCVAFFMLIWNLTKIGLYQSNNTMTKMVAVYLAYKFFVCFIEEPNLNISTYLAMGICLSPIIRQMTDDEIRASFKKLW